MSGTDPGQPRAQGEHGTLDTALAPLGRLALLGAVGLMLGLSPFANGGYSPEIWAPAGFVIAGLLVALLAMGARRPGHAALGALAAIAGLGTLTLVSGGWSPTPALASEHGQRLLVLAGCLGLLFTLLRSRRDATVALGGTIVGVAIVGLWTLIRLLGSTGNELFLGGRLNGPLDYINGQGSIYVLAFAACLAGTAARSWIVAGAAAALATLFADLALLSQSRGVLITLVVASVVVVASVGGRQRRAGATLVVASAVAIAAPALLGILGQHTWQGLPPDAVQSAGRAALSSMLIAGATWGGLVATAGAVRDEAMRQTLRTATAIGLGILAAGALAFAGANAGRIADRARQQVDAFIQIDITADAAGARLLSGSGTRYDYWRVAAGSFQDHPIAGAGGGGFKVAYYRERKTPENILQAHSVIFQTASDLGVLGLALLAAFYSCVMRGLWVAIRRAGTSATDRALTAAACGMTATWILHSNVDWILLLPGVTGVAFVGLAVGLRDGEDSPPAQPTPRPVALASGLLASLLILTTALGLVERLQVRQEVAAASRTQRTDVDQSIGYADRAIKRDPDALEAYYVKAASQARAGRTEATIATLRLAARRQPTEFVTWGLLGDVLARADMLPQARAAYRRSIRLNPRDAGLRNALRAAHEDPS